MSGLPGPLRGDGRALAVAARTCVTAADHVRAVLDGEIVARHEAAIPADPADLIDVVTALAHDLVADAHAPVLGIGVGTPGVVDDHLVHDSGQRLQARVDRRGLVAEDEAGGQQHVT